MAVELIMMRSVLLQQTHGSTVSSFCLYNDVFCMIEFHGTAKTLCDMLRCSDGYPLRWMCKRENHGG